VNNKTGTGSIILYTNSTGSTITAGTLVEIAAGYGGIAVSDILNGETGVLDVDSQFSIPLHTSSAGISQGAAPMYAAGKIVDSAGTVTAAVTLNNARVAATVVSGASTVSVILKPT